MAVVQQRQRAPATRRRTTPAASSYSMRAGGGDPVAASVGAVAAIMDPTTATKLQLLKAVAGLNRGALASEADRMEVDRLARALESAGGLPRPLDGSPAPLDGTWELLYSNTEAFRASPFFAAFADGLVQDRRLADDIFRFTDAIPGAQVGRALQVVDVAAGTLRSEVDLTVWPGLKGTVVTSSRALVERPERPATLRLFVESTSVVNSAFSPALDGVAVPVERLIEQVRGNGATRVLYQCSYVSDDLRVTRSGDQLMLHRRVG